MRHLLFGLVALLAIAGCKKNDILPPAEKNYASFMTETGLSFRGHLDRGYFSWKFGFQQFQSFSGDENGYGICDSTDPVRVVYFGLISEGGGDTRFRLSSPRYDITSESEFSAVFSPGKKKLGNLRSEFHLLMVKGTGVYQSVGSEAGNVIEVLKTEAFTDHVGRKLRVWFRIDAKLSSCSCSSTNSVLADGLMVAEFMGFSK